MSRRIDWEITENVVVSASLTSVANITDLVTDFGWTITAQGGFATATLAILCDEVTAYRFLNDHIGRRIVAKNPFATNNEWIVWEGQIFTVTVDDGDSSSSRTMHDCFNRVSVLYSTIPAGSPQVLGFQAITPVADDTTSQSLYGIRELKRAIGGSVSSEAAALRDLSLLRYKNPKSASAGAGVGVVAPAQVRITVGCVGYYETLRQRFYSTTATGAATLDTIIKAVLTSVGQHISTDTQFMSGNTYARGQYQVGTLTAADYIDALTGLGDGATSQPCWFGIYAQRVPVYFAQSLTVEYYIRKRGDGYRCFDAKTGVEILPWLLRPGKVAQLVDLIPNAVNYTSSLDDISTFVVGEVIFTAPYSATLIPITAYLDDIAIGRMGLGQLGRKHDAILISSIGDRTRVKAPVAALTGQTKYEIRVGEDALVPLWELAGSLSASEKALQAADIQRAKQ